MSKPRTDGMSPGFQKKLKRIWHIEEQRREGKRPPLEKPESDEKFAAKVLQAVVDKTGELPHPDVVKWFSEKTVQTRAERADTATTLRPDDRHIAALFEFFDLDHRDPENWRLMVWLFAYVFFEERKVGKSGRPKKDERDAIVAAIANNPELSGRQLAKKLAGDPSFKTKGISYSTIRRRIGELKGGA
jgi:hypothetical protein